MGFSRHRFFSWCWVSVFVNNDDRIAIAAEARFERPAAEMRAGFSMLGLFKVNPRDGQ
jgi:hypothetical protein